jgi:hypothetical protein
MMPLEAVIQGVGRWTWSKSKSEIGGVLGGGQWGGGQSGSGCSGGRKDRR